MSTDPIPTGPNSYRRPSPLVQMVLARIREFYREPEAVFWVYGFPLLLAIALGIAFRERPVEKIRVDVLQSEADVTSLLELLRGDERIQAESHSQEESQQRLRSAKIDVIVVPRSGGTPPQFEFWFDPNRPESELARFAIESRLLRSANAASAPQISLERQEEPGGRYIDFLIPGLLGMNLMGGGLWGVGFVIVDMRIRKLLKRLLATPMRRSEFLLSIAISRMLFTITEVSSLFVFAYFIFQIRVQGNFLALCAVMIVGAASFMGLGLLLASRAKTTEAISGLMNLAMLPMWVFSGVFFSSERFPEAIQPMIKILPLTALNDALRAVMLEGAALHTQWARLLLLAAWGSISFVLALKWFRWN